MFKVTLILTKFADVKSNTKVDEMFRCSNQCLEPGSGSVGSAKVWLPGTGAAKICGSMVSNPRDKIFTENGKKKLFYPRNSNLNCKKREI